MNLTGAQLYSRAVQGLRSPGGNILDQQFRLVFLYPMLFDTRLQGPYSKTLRDFISVSMLKEIFINNALNIVTIASKDHPLVDEQGKKLDVEKMVKASINKRSGMYGGGYEPQATVSSPRFPIDKYELQKKIEDKTAVIKKYLINDPRTKKLNAFVEIITLDNMIDVPVVVGTKDYQVDTLSLAFVLATALALKKPLNNWRNAQFVFSVIENTKTEDAWKLFIGLVDKEKSGMTDRLITYLSDNNYPRFASGLQKVKSILTAPMQRFGDSRASETIRTLGRDYVGPLIPRSSTVPIRTNMDPKDLRNEMIPKDQKGNVYTGSRGGTYDPDIPFKHQPQFDIMEVVKDNLSQTKLFFKFMLDDNLLRSQFGLDRSPGQMTTAVTKISPHAQAMLHQAHQTFMQYMGQNVSSALFQSFATIYPYDSGINYSELKDEYINAKLNEDIATLVGEFGGALSNTFGGESNDKVTQRVKNVNTLCEKNLENIFDEIGKLGQQIDSNMGNISSHIFDADQFSTFRNTFEKIVDKSYNINRRMEKHLKDSILNGDALLLKVKIAIAKSLDNMLGAYDQNYRAGLVDDQDNSGNPIQVNSNVANMAIVQNKINGLPLVPLDNVLKYKQELRDGLLNIILVHFYASILTAVCSFVEYINVEVETVTNDALDLPNYTLVIPVETVAMLHSAVISKSWRDLVSGGNTQNTNLTDNYIKGIVKFIHKRLDVPNLIVIDSKKGQVYYKLQYMSQVNKTNIRTFETYVKNMTTNELKGNLY